MAPAAPTARLRGAACGLATAALALAAHAAAGGAPSGGGAAAGAVVAVTVGAVAGQARRPGPAHVTALLAAGQAAAHVVFEAAGHGHAGGSPAAPMLAAHLLAVAAAALLIAAGDRLCGALSAVATALLQPRAGVVADVSRTFVAADQPPQWALLRVASIPDRGPPSGALR
ncbi:hypothetical protein LV457_12070 [Mycobacterium sp. MYCO198283]|uniref:hypothetical protein n=1 Tax=Mycobacterium sp. MYCO198283 TaxID=2883505 RepID=UPI001E4595FF|nr:hypothetical protein [Mycobacterium sp. MYCO198283]MCG5433018.1 hypothetical protein [Mycobacterium sp. MYCO198283]